ncbi:MAG: ORF6N domain-containing protein [Planctomycetota bacterium]|jgi:hypothetical protein|nr:ORF6N domain-containing protein [Planctomycetota bacterium]
MASSKRIGNESPSPLDARIYTVRGRRVMLDSDLAEVYGVETKRINEAVKRNPNRFPLNYSFNLTPDEWENLKSQFATSRSWGGRRKLPQAFTEHGAVMLASVLSSPRAIQASIVVVDAFVRLRYVLDANQVLARRIDELAAKVGDHDKAFAVVFEELKRLTVDMAPERPRERIGFKTNRERGITGRARGK